MGDKQEGPKLADYYMSIHYGICAGPVNALRRLFVGGKRAWRGNVTTQRVFRIDEPDLFEGDSQEGGVGGAVYFLPGDVTQVLPEHLAGRLDLTSDTCPAFRGITSIFMYGEEDEGFGAIAGSDGFYWGTNNPYLRPTSVEVTCIPEDWYGAKAPIPRSIGEPEHESYTVDSSGLTANRHDKFDTLGFKNAYADQFALSIKLWSIPDNTQTTIGLPPGATSFTGLHITVDGLIVSRNATSSPGGGEIYFFNFSGSLVSQIDDTLGVLLINFGTIICDIEVEGVHYTIMFATDGVGAQQYIRIKNHTTFSQVTTMDNLAETDFSVGPEYAYYINFAETGVYRIDWGPDTTITSSLVTPAGLTGTIANCAYDSATDSVVIVCVNGDLFRYSPDLTTLIVSNTSTGIGAVLAHQNSNKRMCPGDGSIVIGRQGVVGNWHIHVMSTSDLTTIAEYNSSDQPDWPSPTANFSFIKYNLLFTSLLMVQHASKAEQWFFPVPDIADMNPAHIIYHALTNTDWGMASPISNIDEDAFIAAADVLFTEGFGLSLMWSQQTTIEEFIKDILNHINATLFVRPSTGLLTLKLIRHDYVVGSLPVLDRDNSKVTSYARKGWGDTVNEVNVSWTNPENEEDETVTMQDLGNISMQGGVVSTSKNYHGIRTKELAKRVAARDITAESWPLATAQVEVNREAWDYVPGDCVRLTADEYGISLLVMRITTVDYGKPGDSKIKLSLVEDIFGLALAEYVDEAPASQWEDPNEDPRPIDFALPQTLTYFHAKKVGDVSGAVYPEVRAGVLAAQGGGDTRQFKLLGPTTDTAGNETPYTLLGTRSIVSRATLVSGFDAEAQTVATSADWTTRTQGAGPVAGGFILIGDDEETENELALVTSTSGGNYTLKRAVLDTVPHEWPAATPIWFFSNNSRVHDPITRSALDTISYKVLPVTSNGTLNAGAASPIPLTLTERPWLPTRPADVKVEGIGFGIVDVSADSPPASDVTVTWANRNRLTEDSQPLAWTDATVTPEASQTTTIEVLNPADRSVITAHTGLTGTSFNLPVASFGAFATAIVRVTSERDGYESLQGHEITVVVAPDALGITPPQGNLVLSTAAPSIGNVTPTVIAPPSANLVLSSFAPVTPIVVSPPSANLVLSSSVPAVAASGWTPVDIDDGTTLLAWYDASDTATITESAGAVSQWNDKSSLGNHVVQATAARKPTTGTVTQNGLNVLDFDGGDTLVDTAATLPDNDPGATILVARRADTGVAGWLVFTTNAGATDFSIALGRTSGETRAWGTGANSANYADTSTAWGVVSCTITRTLREIFLNGVSQDTDTVSEAAKTSGRIFIGADNNPTSFLDGKIAEILVIAGTNSTIRQNAENYLMAKWAIP